jgi:hypothetical protein
MLGCEGLKPRGDGPRGGAIDILNIGEPVPVAIMVPSAAVSKQAGWRKGFCWAALNRSHGEFVEHMRSDADEPPASAEGSYPLLLSSSAVVRTASGDQIQPDVIVRNTGSESETK